MIQPPQFIVGEVSKNWGPDAPNEDHELLCQRFERVIAVNLERGYGLHSFQLHRLMTPRGWMNETIIAVFHRIVESES